MATEEEVDNMSDEEFEAFMDSTIDEEEEESTDEIEDETAGADEVTDDEDTDQDEQADEEDDEGTDTEDLNDEEGSDTEDNDDEADEGETGENTQVDEGDSKDDGEDDEDAPKDEDSTDTEDQKDEEGDGSTDKDDKETDTVDYKSEYEKYKTFYDEVTGEFTANGKKMKGFTDPRKIIQSQQMAAGYSDKMAGFKQYRPYMAPLKERGMLEDQAKFDLAMNLIDGDKEALKQHIKNLGIDPMDDLDMDEISYTGQSQVSSAPEIALDELMENAQAHGVKDKVQQVLGEQWDKESVMEFLQDPKAGTDLVEHLSNGAYDAVQQRIAEKKRIDVNGSYSNQPMIRQYREAAAELESEYDQYTEYQKDKAKQEAAEAADKASKVAAEAARIEKERKDADYKARVEQQEKKTNEARLKASSVSKKKVKTKAKAKKEFDPMKLSDEDFMAQIDSFINN